MNHYRRIYTILLQIIVLLFLASCQSYPVGIEVSTRRAQMIYDNGEVKNFTFDRKGNWIMIELTHDALNSSGHALNAQRLLNAKKVKTASEIRYFVKVLSVSTFQDRLKKNGQVPKVEVLE